MVLNNASTAFRLRGWLFVLALVFTLVLPACSSSSDDRTPIDDGAGSTPTMPGNLTALVHSSTEIELFWTPSTDDGLVFVYNVIRDGAVIKEQLDANSYFDRTLAPSSTYEFQVVAVDDNGNHSIPSAISVTTLAGHAPNYIINESTYTSILANVFDVFTGRGAYADRLYALPGFSHTALEDETIGCDNEGTAAIAVFEADREYVFDSCLDGSNLLNGLISTSQYYSSMVEADGFSKVNAAGMESLSGVVERVKGFWRALNIDYEIDSEDAHFHLTSDGFSWLRGFHSGVAFSLGMGGKFNVTSTMFASNAILSVEAEFPTYTLTNLTLREMADARGITVSEFLPDVYFIAGSMTVSAPDGSSVLLDAATGDLPTVSVTLSNKEGSASMMRDWATWSINLQSDVVGSFK